jgi:hypothetical protein
MPEICSPMFCFERHLLPVDKITITRLSWHDPVSFFILNIIRPIYLHRDTRQRSGFCSRAIQREFVVDDVAVGHLFGSPLPITILYSYIFTCRSLCYADIEASLNKPQVIALRRVDIWGQALSSHARTRAHTQTNKQTNKQTHRACALFQGVL